MKPFHVTELFVIDHFTPWKDIGSGTGRIVTFEAIGTIRFDLPTDQTIGMLLGVEVIQSLLKRKEATSITTEHRNESGIPHEDIAIVGRIDIAGNESGIFFGSLDILNSDFPRFPVHLHFFIVAFPIGLG